MIGAAALVLVANVAAPSLPFDDAYVSFSYALHLATGHGLRLSVGSSPVEAFSDPLWVLLMAAGKAVGATIPTWSRIVNTTLIALLAATTAGLARRLNPRAPAWMAVVAAALVAFIPAVVYQAVGGLESLLFAVLVNGVLLAALADRAAPRSLSVITSVLSFLLFLTRPEGLVVWILVWLLSWTSARDVRSQVVAGLWFLVPTLAIELARLSYFHQWLPNSIVAKSGMPLSASAHLVGAEVSRFATEYWPLLGALTIVCVVTVIFRQWLTPLTMVLAVVIGLAATEVAVSAGDNYPYERYLLPLLAPAAAAVVGGLSQLGQVGAAATHSQRRHLGGSGMFRLRMLSATLVIVALAGTWVTAYRHQEPGTTTGPMLNIGRGLSRIPSLFISDRLSEHGGNYQYQLAKLLLRIGRPGEVVATDEIGTVAYYTSLRVVDLYGLADAHIAGLAGSPGSRSDPKYVFDQEPTFFVFHLGGCLCSTIPDDAAYASDARMFDYRLVALLPNIIPDYHGVPPVALLERIPGVKTVVSLDADLPAAAKQKESLPAQLSGTLAPDLAATKVFRPTASQSAAAILGLRGSFTALKVGATTTVSFPSPHRSHCQAVATALSPGSNQPQSLSLSIMGPSGQPSLSATTIGLGTNPVAKTVALDLPATGPAVLRLGPGAQDRTSVAQWAEPRIECGSPLG